MGRYEDLFGEYVNEMRRAREAAIAWWKELISEEAARVGSAESAEWNIRKRWPHGPASHPYVIAVFHKYYLACEALNREWKELRKPGSLKPSADRGETSWGIQERSDAPSDDEGPVPPRVFAIDWLYGRHSDLVRFLADLVLWPIGIDASGRMV